jgi:hypothetical protein
MSVTLKPKSVSVEFYRRALFESMAPVTYTGFQATHLYMSVVFSIQSASSTSLRMDQKSDKVQHNRCRVLSQHLSSIYLRTPNSRDQSIDPALWHIGREGAPVITTAVCPLHTPLNPLMNS